MQSRATGDVNRAVLQGARGQQRRVGCVAPSADHNQRTHVAQLVYCLGGAAGGKHVRRGGRQTVERVIQPGRHELVGVGAAAQSRRAHIGAGLHSGGSDAHGLCRGLPTTPGRPPNQAHHRTALPGAGLSKHVVEAWACGRRLDQSINRLMSAAVSPYGSGVSRAAMMMGPVVGASERALDRSCTKSACLITCTCL